MSNIIDLDNLTIGDIEKLKKALGIKEKETDEQALLRRQQEIGTRPGYMKAIQINKGKRKYFCITEEEAGEFITNYPGERTESFNIELPVTVAKKYLEDPVNVAAFKKGKNNG